MSNVKFFPVIRVSLPFERILRRMGFQEGVTGIARERLEEIKRSVEEAFDLLELKGAGRLLKIGRQGENEIVFENGYAVHSRSVVRFLKRSDEVLFFAATAGAPIMEAIGEKTARGFLHEAAVFDAAASEIVDDALGWIMDYFRNRLRPESKTVGKRRYSAGYGDFALSEQAFFYSTLSLEKLGVTLTESFLLIPEKSVTALASVERIR